MDDVDFGPPDAQVTVRVSVSLDEGGSEDEYVPGWSFTTETAVGTLGEFSMAYRTREVVLDTLQPQHTFDWLAENGHFGTTFDIGTVTFDGSGDVLETNLSFEPEEQLDEGD